MRKCLLAMIALLMSAGCIQQSFSQAIQSTANCALMENQQTHELSCFGCSGTVCRQQTDGWNKADDNMSLRACLATMDGCKLGNTTNAGEQE